MADLSIFDKIIAESQEFKSKKGENVDYNDKKINKKAYKDSEERSKKYLGGVYKEEKKKKGGIVGGDNGLQYLKIDNLTPEKIADYKAQAEGYLNAEDKKKHKNDTDGNNKYTDGITDVLNEPVKERRKAEIKQKIKGLASRVVKKDIEDAEKNKSMFGEADESKTTTIKFKKATFITETAMMKKVPEEFKTEGRKFKMVDKDNNTFLVEWHCEDKPKVLNESGFLNEVAEIHKLFNFSNRVTKNNLKNQDEQFMSTLNTSRNLK